MKIAYCVDGLIEWHVEIRAGIMMVPVHFTGGQITAYGVTPAEFVTSDPVLQRAVEKSPYFRSGRIRVLRRYDADDRTEPLPIPPLTSPRQIVDVPDLASARLQISRLTDVPASRLRTRPEIENAAEKHGIRLSIGKNDPD